jgi:SAM-dependent methyltransferase
MSEDAKPWHEDDEFWGTFTRTLFSEQRWENAPKEVEGIIALLGIEPGAHVLDLCCGVGRHSLEMARLGYRVTGVDRTREYLDLARQKAADEGLEVEFLEGDMRTFRRPGAFDAIVNLFTSFSFFEDPNEDKKVVVNVQQSLRPGGMFLIDLMGKENIARIFLQHDWHEEEDGTLMLQERKVSEDWSWMENRWIQIKRSGKRKEYIFSHRLYSATELKNLLKECGFNDVRAHGDFKGAPYDQNAKRLVVLGRK